MSPEEVIARAIHDLFDPYDKAAAEVTSRILSALKSAGLVVVPEEPTNLMQGYGAIAIMDSEISETDGGAGSHVRMTARLNKIEAAEVYRAMIRASTSPGAPVPVDPARHG